jgi:predicted transcriptional regulator
LHPTASKILLILSRRSTGICNKTAQTLEVPDAQRWEISYHFEELLRERFIILKSDIYALTKKGMSYLSEYPEID